MAARKAPRKRTTRRRPAARPATRRRTRRKQAQAGFTVNPMSVLMAIGGAYVVTQFGHKVPIDDPKMRTGATTAAALFAAWKGPKEMVPFFVGASVASGLQTVAVVFPDLVPQASQTSKRLAMNPAASLFTPSKVYSKGIGRRTASEETQIRQAIQAQMMNRSGAGINGPAQHLNGRTMFINGSRSIFNRR